MGQGSVWPSVLYQDVTEFDHHGGERTSSPDIDRVCGRQILKDVSSLLMVELRSVQSMEPVLAVALCNSIIEKVLGLEKTKDISELPPSMSA